MNKLSVEILETTLEKCNNKLLDIKLSADRREVLLSTASIIKQILVENLDKKT